LFFVGVILLFSVVSDIIKPLLYTFTNIFTLTLIYELLKLM
jgi:hypothetical protein